MFTVATPNRNKLIRAIKKKLRLVPHIKRMLGYRALEPVLKDGVPLVIRDCKIGYHDLYHIEVSRLERIKIAEYMVSGIHGINTRRFHESPIVEEYDARLDEARVAVHEWLTRTSLANTLKIIAWIGWFMLNNINPIDVICQHQKTLKYYRPFF